MTLEPEVPVSAPSPVLALPVSPPSGTPIWVTVVTALSCLGLGLAVSLFTRGSQVAAAPMANCSSAQVREAPKVALDAVGRAALGESKAMEELGAIAVEQRTVVQATALSKGRAVEKRMALEHLRGTLAQVVDAEGLKRLMQFAQDVDTARDAIGAAAALSESKGCDLLYELSTLKSTPMELALLSGQFLSGRELRAKASPALALVLDLREATTCEQRQVILEKSLEIGDKRLVRHIVPLTKKTGCGDKKSDDCHPCLRSENQKLIRDALQKTQARKAPSF